MEYLVLFLPVVLTSGICFAFVTQIVPRNVYVVEGDDEMITCSFENTGVLTVVWRLFPHKAYSQHDIITLQNGTECEVLDNDLFIAGLLSLYCHKNVQMLLLKSIDRSRHREKVLCEVWDNEYNQFKVMIKIEIYVIVPVTSAEMDPNNTVISRNEYDRVQLTCTTSAARPQPNVTWYVTKDLLANGSGEKLDAAATLSFNNIYDSDSPLATRSSIIYIANRSHNGSYVYCASSNYLERVVRSEPILLDIKYAAKVTVGVRGLEGKDTIFVTRNESVQLICQIDSVVTHARLLFDWQTVLVEEAETNVLTYSIDHVTCADAGVYTCVGRNAYTSLLASTEHVALYVKCPPHISSITHMEESVFSNLGENATMKLRILAFPEPDHSSYIWMKETSSGFISLNNSLHMVISTKGLHTTLTITNVTTEDYGKYQVKVTNELGQYTQYYSQDTASNDSRTYSTLTRTVIGCVGGVVILVGLGSLVFIFCKRRSDIRERFCCIRRQNGDNLMTHHASELATATATHPTDAATTYESLRHEYDTVTEYQQITISEEGNKCVYRNMLPT